MSSPLRVRWMAMYSRLFPVLACIPCHQLKEIAFLFGPASRTYAGATTSKLSSAVPEREQKIPRSNQKDDLIRSVKHILPPSVPMAEALTPQDLVVEDGESTVGYSGDGWRVLPNANLYHGGTEHASYNASASATFAFTGSYAWFFGDYNNDHGQLSISIDGASVTSLSTFSATYGASRAVFGKAVQPGTHIMTVTNLDAGKATGVDYFAYRPISADSQPGDSSVPGSDASVTFTPADQWTHDAKSYALTYHGGASFSFPFEGSHVSYFSDKNTDHGRFQVQIDNSAPAIFSSYSPTLQPVQLLFSMDVSPGRHVMTVKNLDDGKAVGADHFVFRPVAPSSPGSSSPAPGTPASTPTQGQTQTESQSLSPTTTGTSTLPGVIVGPGTSLSSPEASGPVSDSSPSSQTPLAQTTGGQSSGASTGVIVGEALGSAVAVLLAVIAVLLVWRWARRRKLEEEAAAPAPHMDQPWTQMTSAPGDHGLPTYTESTGWSAGGSAVGVPVAVAPFPTERKVRNSGGAGILV